MLCNDFVDRLNDIADNRDADRSELVEHTRVCSSCRDAWNAFQQCEQVLAQSRPTLDKCLTDRVLRETTDASKSHRRRKATAVIGLVASVAASALILLSILSRPDPNRPNSNSFATVDQPAALTRAATPSHTQTGTPSVMEQTVNDFWNQTWSPSDSSITATVSGGLRPVAASMNSAFKVIRENVLPRPNRTEPTGEQAGNSNHSLLIV